MRSFTFLLATTALAACSSYDPDLGGIPYECGDAEPKCPSGYSCQDNGTGKQLCISEDGAGVDAKPSGGFTCQDDGMLETHSGSNNDTKERAYVLNMPNITLGPVSICPEGDKDTYQISVTQAMSTITATTTWESGMPVNVTILNAGGSPIGPGSPMGTNTMRSAVAMMPIGLYYVQTSAAATVKNNYRLAITVGQ